MFVVVVVVVVVVFNFPFAMFDPYCTSPPRASGVKKLTFSCSSFFFFFFDMGFSFCCVFYYYFLRLKSNKPVKFQCKTFVVGKQLFMLSHVTLKGE